MNRLAGVRRFLLRAVALCGLATASGGAMAASPAPAGVDLAEFRGKLVYVDFWASWCGPCRAFAPTFTKASENHPDIVFAKVDTEAEQELASAAQIRSIPTLMAFKKGNLVFNQAGALPPAALEQLIQQVKEFDVDAAATAAQQSQGAEEV